MPINWILVLRVQQLVFAFVVLGLSAFVNNWYSTQARLASPSQVNFLVAVPVLSIASLAYAEGVSRFMPRLYKPVVAIAVDALNAVMYFSGFVALAVFLNSLLFCRGNVCGSARAATAFSAFSFGSWASTTTLLALGFLQARRKPSTRTQAMYVAEMKDAAARQ